MNPKHIKAVLGIVIGLASLWLGTWGATVLPEWAQVPCFITSFTCGWLGAALAFSQFIDL